MSPHRQKSAEATTSEQAGAARGDISFILPAHYYNLFYNKELYNKAISWHRTYTNFFLDTSSFAHSLQFYNKSEQLSQKQLTNNQEGFIITSVIIFCFILIWRCERF